MRLRSTRLTAIANAIRDKFYGAALNMRFDNTTSLDSRVTFSRTTNATLTNSAGLVANAPMNLLTFSEQFDNAAWSKLTGGTGVAPVVTANAAAAPNGTTTADQVVFNRGVGTTSSDVSYLAFTLTAFTATATASVWLKTTDGTTKTMSFRCGAPAAQQITVTGEWQRFTLTQTNASIDRVQILLYGNDGAQTVSVYVWGAQLELGSTATTYNPTTVKNLLGFTENFDNAAWTKSNAFVQTNLLAFSAFNAIGTSPTTNAWYETSAALDTTVNSAIAPDGTQTAALLAINSATSFAAVFQVPTTATANTYAYSVYCKAASTDTTCRLLLSGDASVANFVRANFTLSGAGSASVADVSGTAVSAATPTIQAVGDGWYRCTIAGTLTAPTSTRVLVYPGNPGAQTTASQTLVWGAQLVQGTSAGDYKATYAAAAAVGYPDIYGQPFAQKLVENTATAAHRVQVTVVLSGAPVASSAYFKAGERAFGYLRFDDASSTRFAYFNLASGTLGTVDAALSAAIQDVGNGWYRCSAVFAAPVATGSGVCVIGAASTNNVAIYTGDGTSGIYIFGAQLSDSASVDPYVYQPVAAPSSVAYYGPRFDYDPVTLAPKGLLIEEQRSNLLLNSATLSTQVVTVAATAHTLSFYGTGTIVLSGASTGTVVGTGAYPARATLTFTPTVGVLTLTVTGSVTMAQLEAGAFATSYIPTAASQVTRAADSASMIGNNFARWYNQTEGAAYYEGDRIVGASSRQLTFSEGTNANSMLLYSSGVDALQYCTGVAASATVWDLARSPVSSGVPFKQAFGYAANNVGFVLNAGAVIVDTVNTITVVDRMLFGQGPTGVSAQQSQHIKRIAYYNRRLSNSELQSITS